MLRTDELPVSSFISLPPPFDSDDYEPGNCDFRQVLQLPRYSSEPSADEETVAFTPRSVVTLPRGIFVKEWPQAKLVLMDQADDVILPSYGRYGQVIGELGLKYTTNIVAVTAKLTGQLNVSSQEIGLFKLDLVSDSQVLWRQGDSKDQGCPSVLPIFFEIPATYEADGRQWHLPPSLEVSIQRIPFMLVSVVYTLSLTITKSQFWAQWVRNEELALPLEYYPRTRPVRPVGMYGMVLDSVNSVPDEWTQIIDRMDVRPKFQDTMSPLDFQIFVPSIQTFAISETIPFHLQLVGSVVSLREILPTSSPLLLPRDTPQIGSNAPFLKEDNDMSPPITIQVVISRQVMVEVNGRRSARTFTIAEGRLWPVPPTAWPSRLLEERKSEENKCRDGDSESAKKEMLNNQKAVSLDWQGEVKCGPGVDFGGFLTSHVSIKDSLVVSLAPPNPRTSFLVPLQVSHPIKLVTDPWTEDTLHPLDS